MPGKVRTAVGIDIDEKQVLYTDEHQQLVDTSDRNPFVQLVGRIPVISVFRRHKGDSHTGDGNPLIYALKKMRRYRISTSQVLKFMPGVRSILGRIMAGKAYDLIIALPSSHPIASGLARRAGRFQPETPVSYNFFKKCCNREVAEALRASLASEEIPAKRRREITSLIHTLSSSPEEPFALKLVPNMLREYTFPFKINEDTNVQGLSILVVDDLLATGTSIRTASRLLTASGANDITALCLLSSLERARPYASLPQA